MWVCCVLQILAQAPPTAPLPTKAVFRYAPETDTAVAQDVCLQDGFLDLATVSVYINGTFTWSVKARRLPPAPHPQHCLLCVDQHGVPHAHVAMVSWEHDTLLARYKCTIPGIRLC